MGLSQGEEQDLKKVNSESRQRSEDG